MFGTLPVSHAAGAPWSRAVAAALIFHLLLIAAAVSSTSSPPAETRPVARDTIRLDITDVLRSPPSMAEAQPSGREPLVPALPEVPAIDLSAPESELPSFSYRSPGQLSFDPELVQRSSRGAGGSPDTMSPAFAPPELDEFPELVAQPHPRYPDGLRRAGVSGMVQLQFVVGSDGRVDERSIRVLVSSHPGFMLAALQALRGSRFKPARRGGRPTAALVQQTIRFSYR